jgi:hypothetical protein
MTQAARMVLLAEADLRVDLDFGATINSRRIQELVRTHFAIIRAAQTARTNLLDEHGRRLPYATNAF